MQHPFKDAKNQVNTQMAGIKPPQIDLADVADGLCKRCAGHIHSEGEDQSDSSSMESSESVGSLKEVPLYDYKMAKQKSISQISGAGVGLRKIPKSKSYATFTPQSKDLTTKRKILIVDDEPYNLMGLKIIL